MNQKLLDHAKEMGYCCLWAYLEANRSKLTSELVVDIQGVCTPRALQQNRAKHRQKLTSCDELKNCLKKRIKEGHPVEPPHEKR